MPIITEQELIDAAADAQTMEDVVNGSAVSSPVTPRLGGSLKTLAKIQEEIEASMSTIAFGYAFSDTVTMTDPTTGKLRFNNASLSSATALALSDLTNETGNPDISAFFNTWASSTNTLKGTLTVRKLDNAAIFAIYNLTGVTDNTDWSELALTYVTGAGSLTDLDEVFIQFVSTGNKGADGAGTGDMNDVIDDTTPQLGGFLDTNSFAVNESNGAAVASATTTDIFGGNDGNTLHITGTTQIDDFTDASSAGQWRKIVFDGILTLTHGSGITLPGSTSITTAVGDYAFVHADAVGAFTVLYFRADGTSVVAAAGGGQDVLGSYTISSDASFTIGSGLDLDAVIDGTYDRYLLYLNSIIPSTVAVSVWVRTSTDGGSTFDSGASDYSWSRQHSDHSGAYNQANDSTDAQIILNDTNFRSSTGDILHSMVTLLSPSIAQICGIRADTTVNRGAGGSDNALGFELHGQRKAVANVDALEVSISSGTMVSGNAVLVGIKNS